MDLTSTENNNLYLCDLCNKSYKILGSLTRHKNKTHGIIKEKPQNTNGQKKTTKRKKKAAVKKNCIICCKYYSTVSGYKHHLKTYHEGDEPLDNINQATGQPFLWKKRSSKTTEVVSTDDVFVQFENNIPQELRDNDGLRCKICNSLFPNSNQFIEHEKLHFELDASDDEDEDVSFMRLEITNNGTGSNPNDSFKIVSEITCDTCQSTFKSASKHEEHKQLCGKDLLKDFEALRLGCQPTLSSEDKIKEVELSQKIIIFPKDSGSSNKGHLNALFDYFKIIKRKIDCEICGKSCEHPDHLEYHQWWNSS